MIRPFYYQEPTFYILDQRRLPAEELWMPCKSSADVANAIKTLAVRGAPAIGIAAAFGLVLAAKAGEKLEEAAETLINARSTAINLEWSVRRTMKAILDNSGGDTYQTCLQEAEQILKEEIKSNLAIAKLGARLFDQDKKYSILTHCNTGALATGGIGTALGVIKELYLTGKLSMVWVDETRPLLQGSRLTAFELKEDDIPATLITDNMAGWLMKQGKVDAVIVGADRIAKNLDTANKIGTYSLAVLAKAHGIPFYIAAPRSTFDPDTPSGNEIPIEERDNHEVLQFNGNASAPSIPVYNPAFDVTPHELINCIITESKIFRSEPY